MTAPGVCIYTEPGIDSATIDAGYALATLTRAEWEATLVTVEDNDCLSLTVRGVEVTAADCRKALRLISEREDAAVDQHLRRVQWLQNPERAADYRRAAYMEDRA